MPSVSCSVWKRSVEECLSRLAGVFSSTPGLLSCGRQWCKRAVAAFRSVQYTRQTRPPTELRGWSNQPSCAVPVEPDARRRACPCSTEARRRNPDRGSGFGSQNLSFRVIPTFYPIAFRSGNGGDAERPRSFGRGCHVPKSVSSLLSKLQIRPWGSGLPVMAGSCNVSRRGEPSGW